MNNIDIFHEYILKSIFNSENTVWIWASVISNTTCPFLNTSTMYHQYFVLWASPDRGRLLKQWFAIGGPFHTANLGHVINFRFSKQKNNLSGTSVICRNRNKNIFYYIVLLYKLLKWLHN